MGVPVAGVGVGTSDAVGVRVVSAGSDWVGLDEDVAIALGVGVGISDWEIDGVGVSVGVSVGAIYGVAVGAGATTRPAGVGALAAGADGLVHANSTDAVVIRAINATVKATVIGFLSEAILGCPSRGFMTRKCYTTRGGGDGGCHGAMDTCRTAVRGESKRRGSPRSRPCDRNFGARLFGAGPAM